MYGLQEPWVGADPHQVSGAAAVEGIDRATADMHVSRLAADSLASQIDELELFRDPQATLAPAAAAEHAAKQIGRVDLKLRARLVMADALGRSGEIAAGGRMAHEVNRLAVERGDRHLLARSHRVLAWFFSVIGDTSGHLEHAVLCVEYLDDLSSTRIRCDHLMTLGVALGGRGSHAEARSRFQMVGELAVMLGDVDLQISVLCNLSCTEDLDPDGGPQAAMAAAEAMVALSAKHGVPLDATCLDTLARAQMGLGLYADAERTLVNVAASVASSRDMEADGLAQCLITLAETQRFLEAGDRARITLDQCLALCDERGLAAIRARVRQERAELYALEGAFKEAYEQHKIFYAEAEALESAERDVRARTLQAVFETEEARRDSQRFREMSVRDALTGLYNRRFVDERLDSLLLGAASSGLALSIGLVDLDHFKLVNDTLSHGVGDEVLTTVAGLLSATVSEPAFAARLGGEEFLLVLPGCDAEEARSRCELARRRIAAHSWAGLTGDLRVTGSIGVATVVAGRTTRAALLAEADGNLYAAKRAGRNRVVSDAGAPGVDGSGRRRQLRDVI